MLGEMTLDKLKNTAGTPADGGFGVFAFYTKGTDYPNVTATGADGSKPSTISPITITPDFMYNQQIYWDGTSSWTYSPLKYWPNEFAAGAVDAQTTSPAQGAAVNGKVSFFAYGPFAGNVTQTNEATIDGGTVTGATSGIIKISGNNYQGNPTVTYKMSTTGKNVDLLWGTYRTPSVPAVGSNQTGGFVWGYDGTAVPENVANVKKSATEAQRMPTNVNLTKQKTDGKILFDFKHALAKVGGVDGIDIKAVPDVTTKFGNDADAETFITVNSITISATTDSKLAEGKLDLATGIWTENTSVKDNFSQIIKPGASGDNEAELNSAIAEPTSSISDPVANATWQVSGDSYLKTATRVGVTDEATPKAVYASDNGAFFYFDGEIPSMDIRIVYTVRTKDPSLKKGYSEVTQDIKKTVTFTSAVNRSKFYKLHILLGLTSVKFEASVTNWENDGGANDVDVNLPLNVTTP